MRLFLILAIATLFTLPAWSADVARQAHVVELFTSQGCSSCPPADALLGELTSRPDVIALAFHVDYWDSLGWRDRFSMAAATQRQAAYVDTLALSTAFTPQVIVDGQLSFVGSDRGRIEAALTQSTRPSALVPIALSVRDDQLHIVLPEVKANAAGDVMLVAYLPKTATAIGRGENSGRTLVEYNVVRQLRNLGRWEGPSRELTLSLDSLPTDATHVAILLQNHTQIAGAATIAVR